MGNKILITSYINPDLDGVASALAFEYISKQQGRNVEVIFFGQFQPETRYFIEKRKYTFPVVPPETPSSWDSFIVVDTGSTSRLPKCIDPKKVIEVIDHHPAETGQEFPKAKVQNEEVGAAATLVSERIFKEKIRLPKKLAVLLHAAIFNSTLNLTTDVTPRDTFASENLERDFGLDRKIIREMFRFSADYVFAHLHDVIEGDLKTIEVGDKKVTGGQVVLYDIRGQRDALKVQSLSLAAALKRKGSPDVFISLLDLEANSTDIYSDSPFVQEKFGRALGRTFTGNWLVINRLVLRKKLFKILQE
jgi:inorganic pyrophosphatase/exopolyphosphatase